MKKLIMIKYGELTTKKANRKFFVETLSNNIERVLKEYNVTIKKDRVRMYIEFEDKDLNNIIDKLNNVFGLHGIVVADKVNNNIDEIKEVALSKMKNIDAKTFKIETKRADKSFY